MAALEWAASRKSLFGGGDFQAPNLVPEVFLILYLKEISMFEGLFQPMHMLIVFGIALLVFGPKKLPELGKGLGESIRGFKSAMAAKDEEPKPEA
jgi:sec-independent protein translocase protein TatA